VPQQWGRQWADDDDDDDDDDKAHNAMYSTVASIPFHGGVN
jgi:hypothetical protein